MGQPLTIDVSKVDDAKFSIESIINDYEILKNMKFHFDR